MEREWKSDKENEVLKKRPEKERLRMIMKLTQDVEWLSLLCVLEEL